MKILILSQYWYPENGVPQRRWSWLTSVLEQQGHEIVVLAPPPHYKRSVTLLEWLKARGYASPQKGEIGPSGEYIQRTGYFPSGSSLTRRIFNQGWNALSMVSSLARRSGRLGEFHPDLVIGTVPALPTAAVTLFASARCSAPYIIDLRDAWPALFKESESWNAGTGRPSLRERLFTRGPFQALVLTTENMLNIVLKRASGILTTATELEAQVARDFDVPTATVRNVFPSPEMRFSAPASNAAHEELRVLYAGTLGRAQKLENALTAAKIAESLGIKVSLRFVGDGATWDALAARAEDLEVELSLRHQRTPEQLFEDYEWADTALVHLTQWESLKVAVPSKTYELMSNGVHITGVVQGEAAGLIKALKAGDVVEPNNPEALAQLWGELARDRSRLLVPRNGRDWVCEQREVIAPESLARLISKVVDGSEDSHA